jgi:hypothetical protein
VFVVIVIVIVIVLVFVLVLDRHPTVYADFRWLVPRALTMSS